MTIWAILLLLLWQAGAAPLAPVVPPPQKKIAAALLPLPLNLREGAGVRGYDRDLKLITLRASRNGIICTGLRPDDEEFDVRCYHESLLPVVDRMRELDRQGLERNKIYDIVEAEIRSGKLKLPEAPTAGYRMLGPRTAYDADANTAGPAIEGWQSIHFPYRTAAAMALPEEGTVPRTVPYVMATGTFWSHVMIEHDATPQK
jgi:hypothetical protein